MPKIPFYKQLDYMDCGPTCLRIISAFYGKKFTPQFFQDIVGVGRIGSSLMDIGHAAEGIGFRTITAKITLEGLEKEKPFPLILHWNENHFVVLYEIKKSTYYIADPVVGKIKYSKEELQSIFNGSTEVMVLLLEPTPRFYELDNIEKRKKVTFSYFIKFLIPHKKLFFQVFLGLVAGSILSLMIPILTQSLIDIGIQQKNINFIYLLLIAQLMTFVGIMSVSLIRSWVLLHISTRINISIISDFLMKLMKLPIGYFDRKNIGDILQRLRDHDRIKQFLTASSLQTLFSMINILIYAVVLFYYNITVFSIYFLGSSMYIFWVLIFLKKRKVIDYKRFTQLSHIQSNEVQIVQGMQEIKLNQAEMNKRWEWENIQVKLFKVSISSLQLDQIQSIGGSIINEAKNIFIIFISAIQVIEGNMTLGMMMAATQIIGQLNGPLQQLIGFIRQAQDANISLERLGDIHNKNDEDINVFRTYTDKDFEEDINIKNISFKYGGESGPWVLKSINLKIPYKKTTAIVGTSGSGKTTLLKLILKFYDPQKGQISIGEIPLNEISGSEWRKRCGVVMQEGFIFSDTVINNITISEQNPNMHKFDEAIKLSNAYDFINELPLKHLTKIGSGGTGLSTGQKQRIMIARAIYKNPDFIFFDEATSALDSTNEKEISENIKKFSRGKTSIIIAHRLSTVKNADHVIVIEKGEIVENGSHSTLINAKGKYYSLIADQLDLK